MTTNTDVNGGNVTAAGVAKIDEILVTGAVYMGIEPIKKETVGSTFPNPSSSAFSIALNNETSEVDIYNDKGQLVYKTIPENRTLAVEKIFPSGMYIIKTMAKGKSSFVKHIVR